MENQPRCPRCGSYYIETSSDYKIKKGLGYAAEFGIGYLAGRFLGAETATNLVKDVSIADKVNNEWRCNACGYVWSSNNMVIDSHQNQHFQTTPIEPEWTSEDVWDEEIVMGDIPEELPIAQEQKKRNSEIASAQYESKTQTKPHSTKIEQLRELKSLLDDGILTQDEFAAEKAKILNN